MQLVVYSGNLGRDVEMRFSPTGQAVANLSVASNSQYTNAAGEVIKETVWLKVAVWGKLAEACNTYLHKGSHVLVTGKLKADKTTGGPVVFKKTDGTSGSSFEITASVVEFLDGKSSGEAKHEDQTFVAPSDDDIPF